MPNGNVTEVLQKYPKTWAWIDRDTFAMYEGFLERKLLINKCAECDQFFQPPWPTCPNCWSENVVPTEASGNGTVFTFVVLHTGAFMGVEEVDYVNGHPLAVIELVEQPGLRVTGTIVNCANEDIQIGMSVTLTWIERQGAQIPAYEPAPA